MAVTTSATLGGIQERIQNLTYAKFQTAAQMPQYVNVEAVPVGNVVQFFAESVPSALAATIGSGTEGNVNITPDAITLTAKTATMAQWQKNVTVTHLAQAGGRGVANVVSSQLAGALAATVDTEILDLCSGFTGASQTVGSTGTAIALDDIAEAAKALQTTGYMSAYRPVLVLHPQQYFDLWKEMIDLGGVDSLDQNLAMGIVSTIAGADVVISRFVGDDSTDYSGGMFYREYAIGFGYNTVAGGGIIQINGPVSNEQYGGDLWAGYALFDAVEINDTAGVEILSGMSA